LSGGDVRYLAVGVENPPSFELIRRQLDKVSGITTLDINFYDEPHLLVVMLSPYAPRTIKPQDEEFWQGRHKIEIVHPSEIDGVPYVPKQLSELLAVRDKSELTLAHEKERVVRFVPDNFLYFFQDGRFGTSFRRRVVRNGRVVEESPSRVYTDLSEYWREKVEPAFRSGTDGEQCRALTEFVMTMYPIEQRIYADACRESSDGADAAYGELLMASSAARNLLRAIQLQKRDENCTGADEFMQIELLDALYRQMDA